MQLGERQRNSVPRNSRSLASRKKRSCPLAAPPSRYCQVLEVKLQSHLHNTGIANTCNLAKGGNGGTECGGNAIEVGVVKKIEGFRAELEANVFMNGNVLHQRDVPALEAGTTNGSTPF